MYRLLVALAVAAVVASGCMGAGEHMGREVGPVIPEGVAVGALQGTVSDDNFIPIQDASVKLLGSDYETKTGWNGKFSFLRLPAGKYRVVVEATGWTRAEEPIQVQSSAITTLNLFLDPFIVAEPYSRVKEIRGQLSCAHVEAVGQSTAPTCDNLHRDVGFPEDWAATITETTWGPGGISSSGQGVIRLGYSDVGGKGHTYARFVGTSPSRIQLQAGVLHDGLGADTATPPKGQPGPLSIDLYKQPTYLTQDIGAAVTFQQSFVVYHTTFYHEVPPDYDSYTALPGG